MDFKRFSYVIVLAALAFLGYAVHDTRTRTEEGQERPNAIVSYVTQPQKPKGQWVPNETVTGNILAANFAQGQRDWAQANLYLDKLSTTMASDTSTTLRMMLLALSAGQFDRAAEYAQRITSSKQDTDASLPEGTMDAAADGRDLAALVLMAQAVRAGNLEAAEQKLLSIQSMALKAFVQPVIHGWLKAGQKKPVDSTVEGLSLLQALHRGLAAEWATQKETANKVFDSLARAPLTATGAMMVAAYDIRNSRMDEARAALTEALRQNPMDQEAKKIQDALSQGQTPALPPEFSYHLKGVTAGIAMAFRDLAQMMMTDGAGESALIFAQMGRSVRNDVPALAIIVGNIFMEQKRYDEAVLAFQSVSTADIDYVDAQIRLSEIAVERGNNEAAIEILESLMKSNPSPRVAYALGEVYRAGQDNKKAVSAYDQAINAAGGTPDDSLWSVYFVRAMALDELGEWDKAESDLKKALQYRPDNPHVLNYLAYTWADRNINLIQARDMLLKALSLAPADPYITDSLGWVYYRQGDTTQAVILLERAVSLKPYDPTLNDHLGDAYEKAGRHLEARYQWRRALDYADAVKDEKLILSIKEKLAYDQKDVQEK
ncbi:MAG: hypothetical protein EBQ96_00965 [Proteobacteria bacterium]|nr:hypothetical protein [Pseudomonadota bacterium]